jgi:hypothetical protein
MSILLKRNLKKETNEILKDNKKSFKVISILEFKGSQSKVSIKCPIHKDSSEWQNPWLPTISVLKSAKHCLKCSGKYKPTKAELIEDLNDSVFIDGNHTVIDIPEYTNRHSRCVIKCKEHGLSSSWGNPWLPTSKDLKSGYGCPKCYNNYSPTKKEVIDQIDVVLKDTNLTLVDIPNYINRGSNCNINCSFHGNGWEWENKWTPKIKTVKNDIGCPLCAVETNKLKTLLQNPVHFDNERYLYFIKITKKSDKSFFYKIGVNNSENINIRYRKGLLEKADLEISVLEHIKITNIEALFTELYILNKFKENKSYKKVLKDFGLGGATECFSKNILDKTCLTDLVNETILSYQILLDKVNTSKEGIDNFKNYLKQK